LINSVAIEGDLSQIVGRIRIVWLLGIGSGFGSEYGKTVVDLGRVMSIYVTSRRKKSIDQPVIKPRVAT
jgi:hypothetical protein